MARIKIVVSLPPARSDNEVTGWLAEVRPQGGGPGTWAQIGGVRTPDVSEINVGSVPAGSTNEYRVAVIDQFEQRTDSEPQSYTAGKPLPMDPASFTIEEVPE